MLCWSPAVPWPMSQCSLESPSPSLRWSFRYNNGDNNDDDENYNNCGDFTNESMLYWRIFPIHLCGPLNGYIDDNNYNDDDNDDNGYDDGNTGFDS